MEEEERPKEKLKNPPFGKRFPSRASASAKILSKNVLRLRKCLGFSQADLADAIGTDQQAVGLIETTRSNPTLRTIENLARALNTTVPDLLSKPGRRRTGKA
ncbi:helix-turn-helix transcriptional regulator [Bradyrhizobium sp. 200]|nr:helix-turn-helix transcriptional regulator [Bradyrhizobium sp. 200]